MKNKPLIKIIKEKFTCRRCGKQNKVFKTLKRIFEFSLLHECDCGCKRVLISH
jgi:transcription elongation factor Elf1